MAGPAPVGPSMAVEYHNVTLCVVAGLCVVAWHFTHGFRLPVAAVRSVIAAKSLAPHLPDIDAWRARAVGSLDRTCYGCGLADGVTLRTDLNLRPAPAPSHDPSGRE
ncbi:hypothetical protein DFJ74DRAFT_711595 [Hyaloraphidium curvatum]|nr:hypothetical protein DFJ74DRAFT_711595 [Hyaloraphidium curvatum]